MILDFKIPKNNQPIPLEATEVFKGEIFTVFQWQQKMFDGSLETFEKLSRDNTVGVLPVTQDNKIIITRQQQPGMSEFYSLAGGRFDAGENVKEAALRELREETGMVPQELIPWFSVRPSDKIDWVIYIVIARGCSPVGNLQLDAGEKITLQEVTFGEFVDLSRDSKFRDREITTKLYEAEANNRLEEIEKFIFGG